MLALGVRLWNSTDTLKRYTLGMILNNKRLLTYLISCLGFFSVSFLQAQESITFYVVDYPPYILAEDEDKEVKGVDVDITRAAFASQNVPVQFKVLPWKRIVKSMELGLIAGTMSCSIRPEREDFMLFSDQISSVTRAVVSAQNLDTSEITDLPDLANFSVVTVEGWGMQKQLTKLNIDHQTAPDLASAIKAVRYRNVDLLYMAEYPALYYIKQLGVEQDLKVAPIPDEAELPLHVCISKHFPDANVILKTMNQGLLQIKESGLYDQIRTQYLQSN